MTVNELIKVLQSHSDRGYGNLPVTFDGIGFAGTWVEVEYAVPSSEKITARHEDRDGSGLRSITRHVELT